MKNCISKLYFVLLFLLVVIVACDKSEEQEDLYRLDVDFRTPTAKSSQVEITDNPYEQKIQEHSRYTSLPNCCGLNTMVDAWIHEKGRGYFAQDNCMTAQQYYDKLVNETQKNSAYHWTPDSTSMSMKTLMMLNENFPLSTSKNKYGSTTKKTLFSEYKAMDNASEVSEYLRSKENQRTVGGVVLQDENGNGHVAFVSGFYKDTMSFTGYDIFNGNGYTGGKMQIDGSSKKGWRIVGVILK